MLRVTVEPILFFYMMVIFLESNAIQELISVKSCLRVLSPQENTTDCFKKEKNFTADITTVIVEEKTYWARYNGAILFLFTFLSSFYVSSWSDKFGRKFPMLIPPIGTAIAASVNCYLSSFINTRIEFLFISSAISGLTFGTVGIISTTIGFITDISDESSRTKRMMIVEAMIYVGGTAGIYIAGEFLKAHDYSLNFNGFTKLFIFEISVSLLISIYTVFQIPRVSNNSAVSRITFVNLFKLDHVKDTIKTVFRARDPGLRKAVLLLCLSLFFIYFGLVVQFTLAYYLMQDVLKWDIHKYSNFNAGQFAVEGITLLVGMPVFLYKWKVGDHLIAALGIISKMVGYAVFGLSNTDVLAYSCIYWFMFSEYAVPAIRSILSKIVDEDERGKIFGFTTMLQNFCFLIGSFTLTTIYRASIPVFHGLCFELVAFLQLIALGIIIYLYLIKEGIITTYEIMENEDGSVEESCSIERNTGSINRDDV